MAINNLDDAREKNPNPVVRIIPPDLLDSEMFGSWMWLRTVGLEEEVAA